MKNRLNIKDSFKTLSFLFAAVMIVACSKKIIFPTSTILPAAEATLEIEENDNRNYEIDLQLENIAEPSRLTPSREIYMVWMVTERNGTVNIGNLKVSNDNEASLQTTTPFKPLKIFITAEDDRNASVPSTQVVLNSEEFKVD